MAFDPVAAAAVGEFVVAAYRMYDGGKGGLTPAPQGVPAGYTVHSYIIMSDFLPWKKMQEFYGFVAAKSDGTQTVVAMRGTAGTTEWFDNLHTGLVPFREDAGSGSVEQGFNDIYGSIRVVPPGWDPRAPQVAATNASFAEQVAGAAAAHANLTVAKVAQVQSVVATGHSLGGALMTLYVLDNVKKALLRAPLVYTFASPRVGDATFARTFDALPGVTSWRVANKGDLVPNVPPDSWGFVHVAAEELVNDATRVRDTLACHHAMTTYQHVLDPARWPADPGCSP